jgi:glycosyltransferase involved in cell wall biosynthesis
VFWIFCKLLGKYEKLNEHSILRQQTPEKYKYLVRAREALISPDQKNAVYHNFLLSKRAAVIRKMYSVFNTDDRVRIRYKNEDNPFREGNLLILKAPEKNPSGGINKGVIYLQYNNSIAEFASLFDLEALYKEYTLVVEPSSWGYSDLGLELLLHGHNYVYVMAQDSIDYDLCLHLDKRLVPIRAGAGDWINLKASPVEDSTKLFDVCMVASWRKLKNHKLLFKQLAQLGKGIRIALVGYPWENRTAASVRTEQNKYYPDSLVSIFENVPHEYVFKVLSQSKVALMLSEREGANRGIYEALASNIPVVMLENNRGVNKTLVTQGCVKTTVAENLGETVKAILNDSKPSTVKNKLQQISGAANTWKAIGEKLLLKEGIVLAENPLIHSTPNLKYINTAIKEEMDLVYAQLKSYLTGI